MRTVRALAEGEQSRVADTLAEAFQRDPLAGWLHPDPDERRATMGRRFQALLQDLPTGAVVEVTDDLGAAAIWLPPGSDLGNDAGPDSPAAVQEVFARVSALEPPQPFWYLEFLGARVRGAGGGSALLRHRLPLVDAAGLPTALWTGAEANVGFYARHGFRVLHQLDFEGAGAWWLWRDPVRP
jgi:GNAT superfamily N-acetyltransferase